MKKIGFITVGLGFGGAEKMISFVASELAVRSNNVFIFNLMTVPEYIKDRFQKLDKNIKVFDLQRSSLKAQIKAITELSKKNDIDVLIGFMSKPSFLAKIVSMRLGIPSIMSERGDPSKTNGGGLKSIIMRMIINRSKGGVFQTEGAMKFYGKGLQRRGIVIPNPIFVNGDLPKVDFSDRSKSVVSVGRLDNHQKRYDIMIKAFEIFSVSHPDYVLKIYGKGDDEDMIKSWAGESMASEKILFMGLSKNPMLDISSDGMFLITSDYEGISNALLEAMAVGLPCVSTDHSPGGARLLITDRENGLLAPIGDAERLADAMSAFADDPELARKCSENATEVSKRFAPKRIIDMWEEYIEKIVK